MRYALLIPLLVGCNSRIPRQGLLGDWTFQLACDAAADGVPACPGEAPSLVRFHRPDDVRASLAPGEHRTLFPGGPDPDGSYVGVSGPLDATWVDGDLVIELFAASDDPLASPDDLDAWSDHRLVVIGPAADRCWEGEWSWIDDDGVVDATGPAAGTRRGRTCP